VETGNQREGFRGGVKFVLALSLLIGSVGANWLAFRAFDADYFEWYLANGFYIAFFVSALALVWEELPAREDLLSAHPRDYLAGCLAVLSGFFFSMSVFLRDFGGESFTSVSESDEVNSAGDHDPERDTVTEPSRLEEVESSQAAATSVGCFALLFDTFAALFEWLVVMMVMVILLLAALGWVLVIAPVNYFLNLATGAPARQQLREPNYRAVAKKIENRVTYRVWSTRSPLPEGWADFSLARKPFAITQVVNTVVLFAANSVYQYVT
jgi:hypothetical protein